MIFSKLFNSKAKWQHKDANVRIEAIKDELNTSNDQDVQVLKQLAFDDPSDLVKRSALLKLNCFSVWLKAFQTEKNTSIKNLAFERCVQLLATENSNLSVKEKLEYIENSITMTMAEAALDAAQHSELVIALIKKVNKPHKLPNLFIKTKELEVQQYILDQLNDTNTLEKILKRSTCADASQLIKEKLTQIEIEKNKPVKLLKDAHLVLSKLLALKGATNYQAVLEKRTSLNDEWNWLKQDFSCLNDRDKTELIEKLELINPQLDKNLAQIKEQYEQKQLVKNLKVEQQNVIQHFDQQVTKYNKLLADAIFENLELDAVTLAKELEEHNVYVSASVLNDKEKGQYRQAFKELSLKLEQLPELAESVTQATHLISKMAQQTPPENIDQFAERNAVFQSWKKDWQAIESKVSGVIPQSIEGAKKEIVQHWETALAPLRKEQKHLFFLAQKKVTDLKRLIDQGKFNTSFGLFKRFQKLFDQLDQGQQHRLQKDYDQLSSKISELSDWEHYIATPRKQALLEQVKELASNPLDNPNEQASKVKECRNTWNTLGHADEEIDKALNVAFNDACEQAFAPCRLYYAEQEKLRDKHLAVRQAIVKEAQELNSQLTDENASVKALDTGLNKLIQRWREAGEIDRKAYQELNQVFLKATKPIRDLVHKDYEVNAKLKQTLIEQVIAEHNNDDVFEAVNKVKTLQSKWKTIGFAGAKQENRLWSEFRKANDVVFDKRKQEQSKVQSELEIKLTSLLTGLDQLSAIFNESKTIVELKQLEKDLLSFQSEHLSQKPVLPQIKSRVDGLFSQRKRSQ